MNSDELQRISGLLEGDVELKDVVFTFWCMLLCAEFFAMAENQGTGNRVRQENTKYGWCSQQNSLYFAKKQ